MIEIRIHGRGGQGNVVAAYLLATTAFKEGLHVQAFPNFGAERRGAPVTAFVRIAGKPIRQRCQVQQPAFLIIQDEALLDVPGALQGLQPGGGILVNSRKTAGDLCDDAALNLISLPATALALEILGRPVPNTALLSAFLELTGLLTQTALLKALEERFSGDVLARNKTLVSRAAGLVPTAHWEGAPRAASA